MFAEVRACARGAEAARIRATAAAVAELDVTAALAQVAAENRYTRPTFSDDGEMRILAGRHPVIERLAGADAGRFIPNDLYLNIRTEPDRRHHRPQHGRQIDVSAAGGADRDSGADGLASCRRSRRCCRWSTASSRASARRTTWRAAGRRSWWR